MATPLTSREITIIIVACALFMTVSVLLLYRFFLAPVERCLRKWAAKLSYEFVRYQEPGFLAPLWRPSSWVWAPWGIWRVTVRDRAGNEHVALVRIRAPRGDPLPVDVQWEDHRTESPTFVPSWTVGTALLALWALVVLAAIIVVSRLVR